MTPRTSATDAARELNASDPLGGLSVTEYVMRDVYSATPELPTWDDETRGDVMRRRRALRQPITDKLRAEARSRTRVGYWPPAAAVMGYRR